GTRHARMLCRVKTGCRRHRRSFEHLVRTLGLDAVRLEYHGDDQWGHTTAFDIAGRPDALLALNDSDCVLESGFALNVRVPWQASGAGEVKLVRRHPDAYYRNEV